MVAGRDQRLPRRDSSAPIGKPRALREGHEIGSSVQLLGGERPRAPTPFAPRRGRKRIQLGCRRYEARVQRDDAALAEDRLEQDEPDLLVDGGAKRVHVVRLHEANAGNKRLERRALGGLSRRRERAQRAPVEATVQGDDAGLPGRLPGVLQRRFDGLRARVAEERLRATEPGGELRREPLRGLGPVQVRGMPEAVELRLGCGQRGGVAVAERYDGDPASEVEVLATLGVPDAAALTADDRQVGVCVCRQVPLEPLCHRIARHAHATTAVSPISAPIPSRAARTAARASGRSAVSAPDGGSSSASSTCSRRATAPSGRRPGHRRRTGRVRPRAPRRAPSPPRPR